MAETKEVGICDVDRVPEGAVEVTPAELQGRLREIISYAKRTGIVIPVFVFGAPGVGKTDIVTQIGKELNMPVEVFLASTMDPTEIRGIPYPFPEKGYSEWYPQRTWIQNPTDEKPWGQSPGIFFFDELNLATKATMSAFYRLILEGRLDTIDIHNSMRIAAGNLKTQVKEVSDLNLAVRTRFEIYYLKPDAKSWLIWAKAHDVDEKVIGYIEEHPMQIYCVNQVNPEMAKANPRSWTRVSQLLKIGLNTKEDIAGSVGLDPAIKFMQYMANVPERKIPNFGLEKFGGV